MRVRGLYRSGGTYTITAEADDAESARDLLENQVPEGHELTQVHNAMPRGGRVIATGTLRASAVSEITAEGDDYRTAVGSLRAAVPEGSLLLLIAVDDEIASVTG